MPAFILQPLWKVWRPLSGQQLEMTCAETKGSVPRAGWLQGLQWTFRETCFPNFPMSLLGSVLLAACRSDGC